MTFGAQFLKNPDLFPARPAGEPWGEGRVAVDLVGGPYVFTGLDADREAVARRLFAGFCLPPGREAGGVVRCPVMRVAPDEFRSFDLRGWEFTLDLEPAADSVRISGLGLMARLDWRPSLQAALWTGAEDDVFGGVLENVLRVLVAYRLLEEGGALLHSAGIVEREEAWLFLGRSGAGKSTLAGMSLTEGRSVLSDDLNAVVVREGKGVITPVPFAGDHRGNGTERRSLAALCQLRQGSATRLEPISRATALAALLAASPFVNQDPYRLDRLLRNLEGLLGTCPAYRATIALGLGVWDALTQEAAVA